MDRDYFAYAQAGAALPTDDGYAFEVLDSVPFVALDEQEESLHLKERLENHKRKNMILLPQAMIWLGIVVLVFLVIATCKFVEIRRITAAIDSCYERCENLLAENREQQYASQIEQARSKNRISTAATQQLGMVPGESVPVYQVYAPSTRPNEENNRMQNGVNMSAMN